MSSSICRSLTRFTKHNILFTTALPWTAGPCFSWRLRGGQWLASLLPPPPHPTPTPVWWGDAEQTGRGRLVSTSFGTQPPSASAGSVPALALSCSLLTILSWVLSWLLRALRSALSTCISLSWELEPPSSAAGVSLSLEEAMLDSTQDGWMGTHLFLSQDP